MAKPIMIQGTMSNAGKSLLAAGLCRVFWQDGYRTAPFKSQNMALNSYITQEGLEMGRAQVVQAEAARIRPMVEMNPILLKPTNDTGSQVIVNGQVQGMMPAKEYFRCKQQFIPQIMEAYGKLNDSYDIIVLEGAGSPAEINLKENDIVNMGMAGLVNAPVLLVGDIDRGGVFAQLYGTLLLLTKEEQKHVKGLVINKFRGDKSILMPGVLELERLTAKEVLGVVPYMELDIDDEDSLSERFKKRREAGKLDIAVLRFPRISNFTDFNVFDVFEEASVRYVSHAGELGTPDLIFLPGTKNTIGDLLWMRQNGLEAAVLKLASRGTVIFGICGGYQMLGKSICDPEGVEQQGEIRGMGLLPMRTVFQKEKKRTQVKGTFGKVQGSLHALSGLEFSGYEIHMGKSEEMENTQFLSNLHIAGGAVTEGRQAENVYGSYVHGLFDAAGVAAGVVASLMKGKGMDPAGIEKFDPVAYKERQYDLLAEGVRNSFDMKKIYQILEEGV